MFQGYVVELDRLARCHVGDLARRILVRDVTHHIQLLRRHAPVRDFDADHLGIVLALAIDALLEAERAKIVAEAPSREEGLRLFFVVVELPKFDRLGFGALFFASQLFDHEILLSESREQR